MRLPDPLQQVDRTWVFWHAAGRTLAYFGGCDYFRMASHPAVLHVARIALEKSGLNVAASRWTTGHHRTYDLLESALGEFFKAEALLVSNGYLTNLAVIQGVRDRFTHILIDERAHSSLTLAARESGLPVISFGHRDPVDLRKKIPHGAKSLVLTDGVFSHDGSIAPLREYDAFCLVDDSHGAGVLGANGRGTPEFCGVGRERLIQTITLSKAFGSYGGAILADRKTCEEIADRSEALVGATPFPLPCASAALTATRLLGEKKFREDLKFNLERVAPWKEFPIVSVVPRDEAECEALRNSLLARGIFPSRIHYGNGPAQGYFRFAISSEHSRAQLEALRDVIGGG